MSGDDPNQLEPRFGIVKTYELWCRCREVGHRAHWEEGRGRGAGWHQPECPWNRLLGPAPITRHRLLPAGPGAGVPPTKMSRGHYLAGGGGCAGLSLDWDRYYWYNLIIQRINISSPIYDTWYSFSCSFENFQQMWYWWMQCHCLDIQNSFCLSSFLWSCLIFTWQVWMSWLCSCLASTFLQCSDSSSVLQAAVLCCMVCTPRIDPVQAQPAISLCQQGLLFKCRVWISTQTELFLIPYIKSVFFLFYTLDLNFYHQLRAFCRGHNNVNCCMLAISSTVPCASQVSNHCMFLWVGLCPCNGNADSVKKYLICVKVYNME